LYFRWIKISITTYFHISTLLTNSISFSQFFMMGRRQQCNADFLKYQNSLSSLSFSLCVSRQFIGHFRLCAATQTKHLVSFLFCCLKNCMTGWEREIEDKNRWREKYLVLNRNYFKPLLFDSSFITNEKS